MAGCCHDDHCSQESAAKGLNSSAWRRALWVALAVMPRCSAAKSSPAGRPARRPSRPTPWISWRMPSTTRSAWASLDWTGLARQGGRAQGVGLIGVWVIGATASHAYFQTLPEAQVMGAVGILALVANASVALMLYRFRTGDSNMRSVWI